MIVFEYNERPQRVNCFVKECDTRKRERLKEYLAGKNPLFVAYDEVTDTVTEERI